MRYVTPELAVCHALNGPGPQPLRLKYNGKRKAFYGAVVLRKLFRVGSKGTGNCTIGVFVVILPEEPMALILELPADIERELTREAQIRGVPIQTLAVSLIGEAFATKTAAPATAGHSAAQVREWLESLAEFSDRIPAMPTRTFSREMIYSDRG